MNIRQIASAYAEDKAGRVSLDNSQVETRLALEVWEEMAFEVLTFAAQRSAPKA